MRFMDRACIVFYVIKVIGEPIRMDIFLIEFLMRNLSGWKWLKFWSGLGSNPAIKFFSCTLWSFF
jgi:hypothetical protein